MKNHGFSSENDGFSTENDGFSTENEQVAAKKAEVAALAEPPTAEKDGPVRFMILSCCFYAAFMLLLC